MKQLIIIGIVLAGVCLGETSKAADKPKIIREASGMVSVDCQKNVPKDPDARLDKMLDNYREKQLKPFPWQMKLRGMLGGAQPVYNVSFPSAIKTATPENNTVHCEYYPSSKAKGKRPAVIVLHILDGNFILSRMVCNRFATNGIDAMLVKLPYYGQRRAPGTPHFMSQINKPENLMAFITQGVMDIRRAKAFLRSRPDVDKERIGILGMSLGGFATSIACGVDNDFKRAAVLVAGGNLSYVLSHAGAKTEHFRRQCKKQGITEAMLNNMMIPFEPLTYVSRMAKTQLFMINGKQDRIVPARCAKALADSANAYQIWYNGGHFSLIPIINKVVPIVLKHFMDADWTMPSKYFDAEGSPKKTKPRLDVIK